MMLLEELGDTDGALREQPFEELIRFFKENLRRNISVEEMAEVMRLSRSHFTRLFSRVMGMSLRMYLEDLRLKTAMELLFKEQLSVKETASLCGYMMSIIFAAFSGNATGFHRENTGRRISSNL